MTKDNEIKELQSLAGGSTLVLIGLVAFLGLEFATRVILARFLDEVQFGIFFLALRLMNLLIITSLLGLDQGTPQKISAAIAQNGSDEAKPIIGTTIVITIGTGLISGVILWSISDWLQVVFQLAGLSDILKILSIALPAIILMRSFTLVFRGQKRILPKVVFDDITGYGLRFSLILIVAIVGSSILVFAWSITTAALVTVFAYGVYFVRANRLGASFSKQTASALLIFSFPLMAQNLMYQLMTSADVLTLGLYSSAAMLGIYAGALTLGQFIQVGVQTVYFTYLPVATEIHSVNAIDDFKRTYLVVWGTRMQAWMSRKVLISL